MNTFNQLCVKCSHLIGDNIPFALIDHVFTRNLFTQMTWSGLSKNKNTPRKEAFKSYRRVIHFFGNLVCSIDPAYTENRLETFLHKKILNNSERRAKITEQFRASRTKSRSAFKTEFDDDDTTAGAGTHQSVDDVPLEDEEDEVKFPAGAVHTPNEPQSSLEIQSVDVTNPPTQPQQQLLMEKLPSVVTIAVSTVVPSTSTHAVIINDTSSSESQSIPADGQIDIGGNGVTSAISQSKTLTVEETIHTVNNNVISQPKSQSTHDDVEDSSDSESGDEREETGPRAMAKKPAIKRKTSSIQPWNESDREMTEYEMDDDATNAKKTKNNLIHLHVFICASKNR